MTKKRFMAVTVDNGDGKKKKRDTCFEGQHQSLTIMNIFDTLNKFHVKPLGNELRASSFAHSDNLTLKFDIIRVTTGYPKVLWYSSSEGQWSEVVQDFFELKCSNVSNVLKQIEANFGSMNSAGLSSLKEPTVLKRLVIEPRDTSKFISRDDASDCVFSEYRSGFLFHLFFLSALGPIELKGAMPLYKKGDVIPVA